MFGKNAMNLVTWRISVYFLTSMLRSRSLCHTPKWVSKIWQVTSQSLQSLDHGMTIQKCQWLKISFIDEITISIVENGWFQKSARDISGFKSRIRQQKLHGLSALGGYWTLHISLSNLFRTLDAFLDPACHWIFSSWYISHADFEH